MSSMETSYVFPLLLFLRLASIVSELGGIPFLCETPEWLQALENVARASINSAVSINWVKFHFCVNYPFKKRQYSAELCANQTCLRLRVCSVFQSVTSNNGDPHITEHHRNVD